MNYLIKTISFIILFSVPAFAFKESAQVEKAFAEYRKGNKITLSEEMRRVSLDLLLKSDTYSIPQVLYSLRKVKIEKGSDDLSKLKVLLVKRQKKTFKSLYPEHWKFMKAKDYEQMLCNEISSLIEEIINLDKK